MGNSNITLRTATPDDAESLVGIYAPYVEYTAISFEYEVPTVEEFRHRIEKTLQHFPYIVAELDGNIVGYAYAGKFHERAAYSKSAELSIYVRNDIHGKGIGTALYDQLEDDLRQQGITNAYACITWIDTPNEYLTQASPHFHAGRGYERCATFHKCGYKFGLWFDMIYMEKMLGDHI